MIGIHRTTKEFRPSGNTPEFPIGTWFLIERPDALAQADVAGLIAANVPTAHWNVSDGPPRRVTEMTGPQKIAADAALLPGLRQRAMQVIQSRIDSYINSRNYPPEVRGTLSMILVEARVGALAARVALLLPWMVWYLSVVDFQRTRRLAVLAAADRAALATVVASATMPALAATFNATDPSVTVEQAIGT